MPTFSLSYSVNLPSSLKLVLFISLYSYTYSPVLVLLRSFSPFLAISIVLSSFIFFFRILNFGFASLLLCLTFLIETLEFTIRFFFFFLCRYSYLHSLFDFSLFLHIPTFSFHQLIYYLTSVNTISAAVFLHLHLQSYTSHFDTLLRLSSNMMHAANATFLSSSLCKILFLSCLLML